MKTRHRILMSALLALASCIQSTQAVQPGELRAPIPQFMNQEQLAQWNAEQKAPRAQTAQPAETSTRNGIQFFTGKPFDSTSSAYLFKFRSYDPEISRWTSADPSGFPDWPNNYLYGNNPLSGMDPDGLAWGLDDFLWHFYFGGGTPVSLSEIGYLSGVQAVANTSETGGVSRFENQVKDKALGLSKPYNGLFSDEFSNSYDFKGVRWELGSGSLQGIFTGIMTSEPSSFSDGGTYSYTGRADIFYSDTFTDPLDLIQLFYGSSTSPNAPGWLANAVNLGGTAFRIFDAWSQTFSGAGVYE